MNIYIGNLPTSTNENAVFQIFAKYGEVKRVRLLKDRDTNEFRGFGFVEMPVRSQAIDAIDLVNGSSLDGKILKVNEAKPRVEAYNYQRIESRRF